MTAGDVYRYGGIAWFATSGLLMVACTLQVRWMYRLSKSHRPVAPKLLPPLGTSHPLKALFFFTEKNVPLLKLDMKLMAMRQRVKFLLIAWVIVCPGGFVSMALFGSKFLRGY